jgi:hypothetical protein
VRRSISASATIASARNRLRSGTLTDLDIDVGITVVDAVEVRLIDWRRLALPRTHRCRSVARGDGAHRAGRALGRSRRAHCREQGFPARRARVSVGAPLFWSAASLGFTCERSQVAAKAQVRPLSRLPPVEVIAPALAVRMKFGPRLLKMLFVTVSAPDIARFCTPALFLAKVTSSRLPVPTVENMSSGSRPRLTKTPPDGEVLPLSVEFTTSSWSALNATAPNPRSIADEGGLGDGRDAAVNVPYAAAGAWHALYVHVDPSQPQQPGRSSRTSPALKTAAPRRTPGCPGSPRR